MVNGNDASANFGTGRKSFSIARSAISSIWPSKNGIRRTVTTRNNRYRITIGSSRNRVGIVFCLPLWFPADALHSFTWPNTKTGRYAQRAAIPQSRCRSGRFGIGHSLSITAAPARDSIWRKLRLRDRPRMSLRRKTNHRIPPNAPSVETATVNATLTELRLG